MLNDEALSAQEVAKILHIGRNAVYDLAKTGALPSYRMGRKILFALKDVEAYLAASRTDGNNTSENNDSSIDAQPDRQLTVSSKSPLDNGSESNRKSTSHSNRKEFRIGGIGLPTNLIVDRLNESGIDASHANMNSYLALYSIYEHSCDAAVIHLFDQRTNSYNIPYVQRMAPGLPVVVFRMAKRWQGLIVAEGNPKGISSWGALLREDIRLANRARGCGSRILLDEKLLAMEARPETINGYDVEYPTGLTAAKAVAQGFADVAVGGEQIAAQVDGVDFIQMQQEWIDLVIVKEDRNRKLVRETKSMLADDAFRAEYGRIVHGDASDLGAIIYEC